MNKTVPEKEKKEQQNEQDIPFVTGFLADFLDLTLRTSVCVFSKRSAPPRHGQSTRRSSKAFTMNRAAGGVLATRLGPLWSEVRNQKSDVRRRLASVSYPDP